MDDHHDAVRSDRGLTMRRWTIVFCALGAIALGGVLVAKVTSEPADARVDSASTGPIESGGSGTDGAVVAPSSPSDEDRVRDAAIRAVALTDDVFSAGFISRRELIETFTTESFGPVLADETSQQVTNLIFELGDRDVTPSGLSIVEQPLTSNVVSISATRGDGRRVVGAGDRRARSRSGPSGLAHGHCRPGTGSRRVARRRLDLDIGADTRAGCRGVGE